MGTIFNDINLTLTPRANGSYTPSDPDGEYVPYDPQSPTLITGSTGALTQGATRTIIGSNFSSDTQAPFAFTDFEGGTLGTNVASAITWLTGSAGTGREVYLFDDTDPLTGTRIARADPYETNIGDLAAVVDSAEIFVEFFCRVEKHYFGKTGDQSDPQIKYFRIAPTAAHSDAPNLGITHQDGPAEAKGEPTLVHFYGGDHKVDYPAAAHPENEWVRLTAYFRVGDLNTANGNVLMRCSYGNQWSYSGGYFVSPDSWTEPDRITREGAVIDTTIERVYFPFYQREQQITTIDINHILVHTTRESVLLSTSPTYSASIDYKHVHCPCISRDFGQVIYKSMIDCLPADAAVYEYVINRDGTANTDGFLVRAAA